MRVEEISLRNFRRFRRAEFALSEGINVIKGPNESGKSTLMQAILAAFYWRADSTRREVRESVSWGADDGFRLEVRGEAQGRPFQLVKDFSARRSRLVWGEAETSDPVRIEETVRDWLGLGSEDAFRATAGIRQDEVADIGRGGKEIAQGLQAAVGGSGGGMGATRALDSLRKELSELRKGMRGTAKNPGPLVRLEDEISRLEGSRESLSRAVGERQAARRRLAEIAGEEAAAQERLEILEKIIQDAQEREEIEEDIEDFQRRYRQLESAARLAEEDERLAVEEERRFARLRRVLEEKQEELQEMEIRRAGIAERVRSQRQKLEEAMTARYAPWAPALLVSGLTLMLVGAAGMVLTPYLLILSGIGAAMVLASLFPGGYSSFLGRGRAVAVLRRGLGELEEEERKVLDQAREAIALAGCDSWDQFRALRLQYLELLERRKEIAGKLEVLVPGGERDRLEDELRKLAVEVSVRERRLKELRGKAVDPYRLQEVLREKERLEERLAALTEERISCQVTVSKEDPEEELARTEEELAQRKANLERLRKRERALEKAIEWLERASAEVLSPLSGRLEEMIGDFLARITGGRYRKVAVDRGTLKITVWSEERGGELGPESLSRGTADQIYLAARLSLADIICGERRPPLLLDDPFVTFDAVRLERAMELLREFSRRYQVLLFTCGDHYDRYADRLVDLRSA